MNEIITRGENVSEVDVTSREKWCWSWMEKTVEVDPAAILDNTSYKGGKLVINLKDHIRKVRQDGDAVCTLCTNKTISYKNRGLVALKDHVKTELHVGKVVSLLGSYAVPGGSAPSNDETYGLAPVYATSSILPEKSPLPAVHVKDRRANKRCL